MNRHEETKDLEQAAMKSIKKKEVHEVEVDPTDPAFFDIRPGKPLPEGFQNPACGDPGHYCVDLGGNYNPEWFALMLERTHDHQVNPQPFPLMGRTYQVPLDKWVDAPPEVIESLKSAVETHHERNFTPQQVALGQPVVPSKVDRRRFHWQAYPSK